MAEANGNELVAGTVLLQGDNHFYKTTDSLNSLPSHLWDGLLNKRLKALAKSQ